MRRKRPFACRESNESSRPFPDIRTGIQHRVTRWIPGNGQRLEGLDFRIRGRPRRLTPAYVIIVGERGHSDCAAEKMVFVVKVDSWYRGFELISGVRTLRPVAE